MTSPNFISIAAKTWKMNYDVMKWATFSPRNITHALENLQFTQYFTKKFNIFSLNSTGESDFLILFISTHNKLSLSGFNKIWMIRVLVVVNYIVRKFSFCSNLYADVIAKIILLHIFINLKIVFISWNMILQLKSFISIVTFIIHKNG